MNQSLLEATLIEIDGKILGVSAYALAFTFTTAISILLFVLVSQALGSGWRIRWR